MGRPEGTRVSWVVKEAAAFITLLLHIEKYEGHEKWHKLLFKSSARLFHLREYYVAVPPSLDTPHMAPAVNLATDGVGDRQLGACQIGMVSVASAVTWESPRGPFREISTY